ncbi:MAG: alpha-E domain-containing protein, partial [Pseudomonadota bacterium]
NMTRNFGWHFMDLGRRLERASQMAELLRRILVESFDESEETERLAFLLETADSFMTYRSRYRFAPTFPLVLDLLLIDEQNPRSLAYQLRAVSDHMRRMPQASMDAIRTPEQRLALDTLTQVRLADIERLRRSDNSGLRTELATLLDDLLAKLPELSDTISRRYFSLTEDQPQRVHTRLLP